MNPTPLITLFTAPKPYSRRDTADAQRLAIQSWINLGPQCRVVLVGDEDGIGEAACAYGVGHIPEIGRNEFGTPLVSAVFSAVETSSTTPLLCYLNADIVLMSDFLDAITSIMLPSFLMVGRRWNIDPHHVPDPTTPDWEQRLREQVRLHGRLYSHDAIDYFVYTRGLWPHLPPLTIGRPAWDNYMIYSARARNIPVIDATPAFRAVHQNHDYSHHASGHTGVWFGPEAERNRQLAGGPRHMFTTSDATLHLTSHGLRRPPRTTARLIRIVENEPVLRPYLKVPYRIARTGLVLLHRWERSQGWPRSRRSEIGSRKSRARDDHAASRS